MADVLCSGQDRPALPNKLHLAKMASVRLYLKVILIGLLAFLPLRVSLLESRKAAQKEERKKGGRA